MYKKKTVSTLILCVFLLYLFPINTIGFGENLVSNPGFENTYGNGARGWNATGGWGGKNVSLYKENPHSGENAVKITTDDPKLNPLINQYVTGIIPYAQYKVSVWLMTESLSGKGAAFKFENYRIEGTDINSRVSVGGHGNSEYFTEETGPVWTYFEQTYTAPKDCNMLSICLRIYGAGTVIYDDVSIVMTAPPPKLLLSTDEVFYYTEWERGLAIGIANTSYYSELASCTIDFRLKDKSTVLLEQLDTAEFVFDLSLLSVKGKEYTIEAILKTFEGEVIETAIKPIYRYDRPTVINEDGIYIKDNKPFNPVIAYHVQDYQFPYCHDAGINVVQSWNTLSVDNMQQQLDTAYENNLMVLLTLYKGMKPAGHPDNIEVTIEAVQRLKNHPALFAYAIMDEPYAHYREADELLKMSYKTIRDIDPHHPVYVCEAGSLSFEKAGKYVDVLAVDPYPGDSYTPTKHVSETTFKAIEAIRSRKPVYVILQAFEYKGYFPSSDEMRNMMYQPFFEGAKGIGFYEFDISIQSPRTPLNETSLWPVLTSFNELEMNTVFENFVCNQYASQYRGDDVWWRIYEQDFHKDIYILNRDDTSKSINIMELEGTFYVEEVNGGHIENIEINDGNLVAKLLPSQALSVKISKPQLIVNPSFEEMHESVPVKWLDSTYNNWASDIIQIDDDDYGGNCAKISANGDYKYPFVQQALAVPGNIERGGKYELRFRFKTKAQNQHATPRVSIICGAANASVYTKTIDFLHNRTDITLTKNNETTKRTEDSVFEMTPEDTWTNYSIYFSVPSDENVSYVEIRFRGNYNAGHPFYYDDITVTEALDSFEFYNQSGYKINAAEEGVITVKCTYFTDTDSKENFKLIVGTYNHDENISELLMIAPIVSGTAPIGKPLNLEGSIEVFQNQIVKAFLWNGKNQMMPFSKSIEITSK